jgi:hypothetical protein
VGERRCGRMKEVRGIEVRRVRRFNEENNNL